MNPKEIAETLTLVQTVVEQWLVFRKYHQKGVSGAPISPEEENEFLETTSAMAKNVRTLTQRVDVKKFPFRAEEISAQLKTAISIKHFNGMKPGDQKVFAKDWHQSLVYLNRLLGVYKFLQEGYRPVDKSKKKKGFFAKLLKK